MGGRQCTICAHDKRHQIELGIVAKVSSHVLAARFGVSHDAIKRHSDNHLTQVQRAALLAARKPSEIDLEALRTSETEGLLSQLIGQRARLHQHSELATELGDVRGAVAAENAITGNLKLVAQLLGQLVQHHDLRHTSILISPDYLRLREVLVRALRPFPAAAQAVGAALCAMEAEAAKDITAKAGKPPPMITAPTTTIDVVPDAPTIVRCRCHADRPRHRHGMRSGIACPRRRYRSRRLASGLSAVNFETLLTQLQQTKRQIDIGRNQSAPHLLLHR
jgi:hypothetical protein